MVSDARFERAASASRTRRSGQTELIRGGGLRQIVDSSKVWSGSPSWDRTSDIQINSLTLCLLSYRGTGEREEISRN